MASKREFYSIILDWLLVIVTPIIALALLTFSPDSHDFSVVDLTISYGHRARPKVHLPLLIFLAVIMPILFITVLSLYSFNFVSLFTGNRPSSSQLRHLNANLLGLGVSLATATVILNVKNLAGKPRPDFLDRCRPDVDNVLAYAVGGSYGRSISDRWIIVTREICQADPQDVNEGFRSFPSGYATIAFAGLWYLTLYLSAKLRVSALRDSLSNGRGRNDGVRRHTHSSGVEDAEELDALLPLTDTIEQRQAQPPRARPPTFLLILPYTSFGLALFIAGTRYFDFCNHGFDVLAGAAAGTVTASFAFQLYGDGRETL